MKLIYINLRNTVCVAFVLLVFSTAQAAQKYSPNDVFTGVEYANVLVSSILSGKGISPTEIPLSREQAAKPMHVYELQVSVLAELYDYAIKNNRTPPPLATSTPIKYTPTDVYYLTQLILNNLKEIYTDAGGVITGKSVKRYSDKTPSDVYQELFKLYYQLNLLNGKSKVSPSEVYAHIYRAKEDLQYSLLLLSKRLDNSKEKEKRLLLTATYGMHPDGTTLTPLEKGKKPADVQGMAFNVREKLNVLRVKNKLAEIKSPVLGDYSGNINPIDVFLQTQFIIAELNLLKIPMGINSATSNAKPVTGKTPSDVFQEMKHINYMLERLVQVL